MNDITLWQFVTGDWAGHHFGPIQIIVLVLAGLEIPIAATIWIMAALARLGMTGLKSPEPAAPTHHSGAQLAPQQLDEYAAALARLTPISGAHT